MERLSDPLHDRFLHKLASPPHHPLMHSLLFNKNSLIPNLAILKDHLYREGRLLKQDFIHIISTASEILSQEPNLLELSDPITIIGDIHGQFYDLIKILELAGNLSCVQYLFLGDFIDRGSFSTEVLMLIYALKINYPKSVFLLRGNHESRQLSSFFNFRKECLEKFDLEVYDLIMDSFDNLPLACIINKKFFGVHGGISPELKVMSNIHEINRKTEPPSSGLFCDLLWADPIDSETGSSTEDYKTNEERGCSFYFSAHPLNRFLKKNKLFAVIRAHEAQPDGYKIYRWNGNSEFPAVLTVFSAPNYCDVYKNKGAIVKFLNNCLHIQQYNYTVHPYILPDFMNAFTWSVPFVVERVLEMFYAVIKDRENNEQLSKAEKREHLRKKILAISKMIKMFKVLRNDNELVIQLKGLCPDNKIPKGLLQQGKKALEGALESFNLAKKLDKSNERRPNLTKSL